MDLVIVIAALLVYFAYFVKSCPKIIKKYKQLLLGIFIGLLIYKYMNFEGNGDFGWGGPVIVALFFFLLAGVNGFMAARESTESRAPTQIEMDEFRPF